jgi:aminotransferase
MHTGPFINVRFIAHHEPWISAFLSIRTHSKTVLVVKILRVSTTYEGATRIQRLPTQFFSTLVQQVQQHLANGRDMINLGQGNPDLPTPSHIVHALQQASNRAAFHRYAPFHGHDFLKEAICRRYATDFGVVLDPSEVAILFGGKTGLVEISTVLLNPGDVCLVPDPGYPDYASGVALAGGRMVRMPLCASHDYLPDFSALHAHDVAHAKLMFLNYPNNPTATIAPAAFYAHAVEWAAQRGIAIVADFAYGALTFDGVRAPSFLATAGAREVGIEVYTLSKTYNMAGWRVGFALGNRSLIRLIEQLQEHMYVSLFGAVQWAAAEALNGPQDSVKTLVDTYTQRRDVWHAAIEQIGWQGVKKSAGSFFSWLPVPPTMDSLSFARRLIEDAGVVVAPGRGFGAHGEGFVRVALLSSQARLQEAAARIGALHLWDA